MKITAFNGSPKGKKGNTNVIVEAFLEGAAKAGAETENIFLVEKTINHCRGCLSCWFKTPGKCIIEDDMPPLIEKFGKSDIIIFATPLYVDNVTGIMKNFMDRLIPGANPYVIKDENGECKHQISIEPPKFIVISNCGFPEQSHFQVLKLLFRRIARNSSSEIIGEIYRGGGGFLAEHPSILKPLVFRYKQIVRQAGKEIVENEKISEKTAALLEKPLLPEEQYISGLNQVINQMLKKTNG